MNDKTCAVEKFSPEKMPVLENADPFFSEGNIRYLEEIVHDLESGNAKLLEHDLIEDF